MTVPVATRQRRGVSGLMVGPGGPVFVSPSWFHVPGRCSYRSCPSCRPLQLRRGVSRFAGNPCRRCFLPIAVRCDPDDSEVVQQPVHSCHGHLSAGEDVVPPPVWKVAGDQKGFALVEVADRLKQHRELQLAVAP